MPHIPAHGASGPKNPPIKRGTSGKVSGGGKPKVAPKGRSTRRKR